MRGNSGDYEVEIRRLGQVVFMLPPSALILHTYLYEVPNLPSYPTANTTSADHDHPSYTIFVE